MVVFSWILFVWLIIDLIIAIIGKYYTSIIADLLGVVFLCILLFGGITVIPLAWVLFGIQALAVAINLFRGLEGLIIIALQTPIIVYFCLTLF